MFERHGLNVARQEDNAANPRPDNRSGWLEGETPDVITGALASAAGETPDVIAGALGSPPAAGPAVPGEDAAALEIRLWNPATQLRYRAKRTVPPRPDGAPNRVPVG